MVNIKACLLKSFERQFPIKFRWVQNESQMKAHIIKTNRMDGPNSMY